MQSSFMDNIKETSNKKGKFKTQYEAVLFHTNIKNFLLIERNLPVESLISTL